MKPGAAFFPGIIRLLPCGETAAATRDALCVSLCGDYLSTRSPTIAGRDPRTAPAASCAGFFSEKNSHSPSIDSALDFYVVNRAPALPIEVGLTLA